MKNLKQVLEICKTFGEPIFEQNKKLFDGKLVIQERIKIDMPNMLDELVIHLISNFCKSHNFTCQIVSIDKEIYQKFQLQLYEKVKWMLSKEEVINEMNESIAFGRNVDIDRTPRIMEYLDAIAIGIRYLVEQR